MAYGIENMLDIDMVLADANPSCKKELLQLLAEQASTKIGADKRKIFDVLLERERLGSTGVGNGIAIPHGKLPELNKMFAIFARLRKPVKYESEDDQPIDIVFLLLAPETDGADHLKALSRVARVLRDGDLVNEIRNSADQATMFSLLTRIPAQDAA